MSETIVQPLRARSGHFPIAKTPSLHRRIRAELEHKILSGEWPPGHRLPFEHELTAQYDCARMTVNKVMAELVTAGLIERRRRAGSFVTRPRLQSAVLEIPDIEAEVLARGATYGYELRGLRRRPAAQEDAIAQGDVLAIACRHFSGGRPFAVEDRLISLAAVPEAADVDFAKTAPGAWLLDHVPWTQGEHRIAAVNAPAGIAKLLDVPRGAACLVLERRTWRDKDTITIVRQHFRGDLYDLVARFAPR